MPKPPSDNGLCDLGSASDLFGGHFYVGIVQVVADFLKGHLKLGLGRLGGSLENLAERQLDRDVGLFQQLDFVEKSLGHELWVLQFCNHCLESPQVQVDSVCSLFHEHPFVVGSTSLQRAMDPHVLSHDVLVFGVWKQLRNADGLIRLELQIVKDLFRHLAQFREAQQPKSLEQSEQTNAGLCKVFMDFVFHQLELEITFHPLKLGQKLLIDLVLFSKLVLLVALGLLDAFRVVVDLCLAEPVQVQESVDMLDQMLQLVPKLPVSQMQLAGVFVQVEFDRFEEQVGHLGQLQIVDERGKRHGWEF
ncbi:hypothetical protein OGAPHI_006610 [Ogataea philodendri]|uniref:Uncharacterized protein n=1 Tax=Ogataea philodendri TaxID=1378263 RepID=A0A9P8SZZ5_9ASCO|nr:uncharacterized protein OGAPHI_006610 [Ogataea philodendri]KAH3661203.1 hypothetical protein OGAPHI_006610 [Ogataea philodendri]